MPIGEAERAWRPTPAELKEEFALRRRGEPFVAYQRGPGIEFLVLAPDVVNVSIGRAVDCDIQLTGDPRVSDLHAELRRLGSDWVLVDDGLSRNGTFVNEERIGTRRRLRDGDRLRCGRIALRFHANNPARTETQLDDAPLAPVLSPAQRRVLVGLCRPCALSPGIPIPASNRAIAEELSISVEAVKTHLRSLFERFEVGDLPQNQKRARLAELAIASRAVTLDELASDEP